MSNNDFPRPVILGCAGPVLQPGEYAQFKELKPFGFILMGRNCVNRDQIKTLIGDMREACGRPDAPVFIDQEGGRVARLKAPGWPKFPAARVFGKIWQIDQGLAKEAAKINGQLLALELTKVNINVNCAPVLDLTFTATHDAIGDRSFSASPDAVVDCATAFAEGMMSMGVLPVIKHLPGHGRATVDPHLQLPIVDATLEQLKSSDFVPFKRMNKAPIGMTSHILFRLVDADQPASLSSAIINDIIRKEIGFDGLLFSDDMEMKALSGTLEVRAKKALAAGTDIVLFCGADVQAKTDLAAGLPRMSELSWKRWLRAQQALPQTRPPLLISDMTERLDMILGTVEFSQTMKA